MFRSIEEVIVRWQELYDTGTPFGKFPDFKIGSPGHSESEIESLEQELGIVLHPTFKSFLRKARFDTTTFLHASFSFGIQIDLLRMQNRGTGERLFDRAITDKKRYLEIGASNPHIFVFDNENGSVYVFDHDAVNPKLEKVASDAEMFVCALASIADIVMHKDDEYMRSQEMNDLIGSLVREADQIDPNEFWYDFAGWYT